MPCREKGPVSEVQSDGTIAAIGGTVKKGQNVLHRKEVQYQQGGEQPQYEFKRAVSLGRENLDDRLDFVKAREFSQCGVGG